MPKSKRDKTISLTNTKKKGLEFKQNLIVEIRQSLDSYDYLYVITFQNQRNLFLKDLRQKWSDSKFLFGKNKVISIALGRDPESEHQANLHKIGSYLKGNIGLLFTNKSPEDVTKFFNAYSCPDYARTGNEATETVVLNEGPLEQFQHTMEPQLRKLGMRTSLRKGIVHLDSDFTVCEAGDKLTADQARILKLFGYMQAEFKIIVKLYWNKSGNIKILDETVQQPIGSENDDDEDEEDDEEGEEDGEEEDEEDEEEEEEEEEPKELPKKKKQRK